MLTTVFANIISITIKFAETVIVFELLAKSCSALSTNFVIVDIENAEILFSLEALSDVGGSILCDSVIVQEKHVQPNVAFQTVTQTGHHNIVQIIFTHVNRLKQKNQLIIYLLHK